MRTVTFTALCPCGRDATWTQTTIDPNRDTVIRYDINCLGCVR